MRMYIMINMHSKGNHIEVVEAEPMTYSDYCGNRAIDEAKRWLDGYAVRWRDRRELVTDRSEWWDKREFDAVTHPVCGMAFGMAIGAMKCGFKVARKEWNGKGMWLSLPLADGAREVPASKVWGRANEAYAHQNGGTVKVMPYITMKSAYGSIVMGWLASQTDMLSEDWYLIAETDEPTEGR